MAIKKKLQDHIERKSYTLEEFIAVVDKNGNKEISVAEFEAQTKTFLRADEAVALFRAIDHDNSNSLTVDEIKIELASIDAAMILKKVKASLEETKMDSFNTLASFDDDQSGKMEINEFSEFINLAG